MGDHFHEKVFEHKNSFARSIKHSFGLCCLLQYRIGGYGEEETKNYVMWSSSVSFLRYNRNLYVRIFYFMIFLNLFFIIQRYKNM